MRREWIEMLLHGGANMKCVGLPPCGGSGLKLAMISVYTGFPGCLPPCGGSGLKYEIVAISVLFRPGLPPCGGSGLK